MDASATSLGKMIVELSGESAEYKAMWREAEAIAETSLGSITQLAKMTTLAVTATLAAIGTVAVAEFTKFDAAMVNSLAIMDNVSKQMRSEMEKTARDVAKTTTTSATEAATAYRYLASAGLTAQQAMGALPEVARFAAASSIKMETATALLTRSLAGLGLASKDAAEYQRNLIRVMDVMTTAANVADGDATDYAISLRTKVGASLRLLNKDVEEGVAVLMAYGKQGILAENAGEQLSQVLRDLQNAVNDNQLIWKQMNVAVYDAQGQMRPIVDIIDDLDRAMKGMSDKQKALALGMMGFQDRSVSAVKALFGTTASIREYERALRDASGATKEVADKQLESFSAQLAITRNRLMDVLLVVGEQLMPMVKEFNKLIGDSADAQSGFAEKAQLVADVVKTGLLVGIGVVADVWAGFNLIILEGQKIMIALAGAYKYASGIVQIAVLGAGAIVEAVFRGWQKLFVTVFYAIKIGFLEFGAWLNEKSIQIAEILNKILPKDRQYGKEWFAEARKQVISLSQDIVKAEAARANAMANTTNDNLAALQKAGAETAKFREEVLAGTDEFTQANLRIQKEIDDMISKGRPSDEIVKRWTDLTDEIKKTGNAATKTAGQVKDAATETGNSTNEVVNIFTRRSPEVLQLLKDIAYEWEAQAIALANLDKMYKDGAINLMEYARAKQSLNLKGAGQDQLETALFQVQRLDEALKKGIITINEYNAAFNRQIGGASPFMNLKDTRFSGADLNSPITGGMVSGQYEQEQLKNQLEVQMNLVRQYYDQKKSVEIEATESIEKEKQSVLKEMQENFATLQKHYTLLNAQGMVQIFQNSFDQLADFAKTVAGEQSGLYKAMFFMSRAAAAAMAAVNAFVAYTQALAYIPPPFNIPIANFALASGLAASAAILGTAIASFEGGGSLADGPRVGGMDGRGGKLIVAHPGEKIIDPKTSTGVDGLTVNINNYTDSSVDVQKRDDGKTVDIIIKKAVREVASDIRNGGGPVSAALETSYRVGRGKG